MHHPDGTGPDRSGPAHRPQRNHAAIGAAVLAAAVAGVWGFTHHAHESAAPQARQMGAGPRDPAATQLANFGNDSPSPDARLMANWVLGTHDNGQHAFILVDKKEAHVYVFDPAGHLAGSTPALMGAARGDELVPGTANLPLSKMTFEDKRTPAGRFVAEVGQNADNEDVIWVDYKDAISMHRVRPQVAAERRLERLATPVTDDNRISFGCINLPVSFYEDVAKPTAQKYGAVVYVLPEVKTLQQVFNAYDVTDPAQLAAARQSSNVADAAGHNGPAAPQG
jgi:hypothetical protein